MLYSKFIKSLKGSDVVESVRAFGHAINLHEDGLVSIDGQKTEFDSLEEARIYIKNKTISEKLEHQISNEVYEEISENLIANIIKEYHEVKVTDTLIESYIDLASSKIFTVDPVVYEIRKLNKLDVVIENKVHYELKDGSTVAIDSMTQETLNNILADQKDVVEYMRESKENFISVVQQIKE